MSHKENPRVKGSSLALCVLICVFAFLILRKAEISDSCDGEFFSSSKQQQISQAVKNTINEIKHLIKYRHSPLLYLTRSRALYTMEGKNVPYNSFYFICKCIPVIVSYSCTGRPLERNGPSVCAHSAAVSRKCRGLVPLSSRYSTLI